MEFTNLLVGLYVLGMFVYIIHKGFIGETMRDYMKTGIA